MGNRPKIDPTPRRPKPPERLIGAAETSLVEALGNLPPNDDGQVQIKAPWAVSLTVRQSHGQAASEWAVARLIQSGRCNAVASRVRMRPVVWAGTVEDLPSEVPRTSVRNSASLDRPASVIATMSADGPGGSIDSYRDRRHLKHSTTAPPVTAHRLASGTHPPQVGQIRSFGSNAIRASRRRSERLRPFRGWFDANSFRRHDKQRADAL